MSILSKFISLQPFKKIKLLRISQNAPLDTPISQLYINFNTLPLPDLHNYQIMKFIHKYIEYTKYKHILEKPVQKPERSIERLKAFTEEILVISHGKLFQTLITRSEKNKPGCITATTLKQEFVRPRWPYDMRPSARADKYMCVIVIR